MSMISAFFSEFEFRSGEMYSIQYYVIKFLSDLRLAGGLFLGTPVSSTNKTSRYICDIVESGVKYHKPSTTRGNTCLTA
jgi:hypothetical protein